MKGKEAQLVIDERPRDSNVIDLMERLRQSLDKSGQAGSGGRSRTRREGGSARAKTRKTSPRARKQRRKGHAAA
jgi:non-homologous end joining protein Ku